MGHVTTLPGSGGYSPPSFSIPLLRTTVWHDPSLRYPVYPRTGCEFRHGGFAAPEEGIGWEGMRIVRPDSPFISGTGLASGNVVRLPLPEASVWDGAPVAPGPDGVPRVEFGDSPPGVTR